METIQITLPDGATREVPKGTTAAEIARQISPRLAKEALVARTNGGFTVSTNTVVPVASINSFGACTAGSGTATYMCWGKTGGGASIILWSGTVTPNIAVSNGVTPSLTTATTLTIT